MILRRLSLHNFRSYTKTDFSFDPNLTIIVGPNGVGKTNLVEAIGLLSTGKSFRAGKEKQVIAFDEPICRVKGQILTNEGSVGRHPRPTALSATLPAGARRGTPTPATHVISEKDEIEIVFAETPTNFLRKQYLINGVSRRRSALSGLLPTVLFTPLDLDIVSGQPGSRRNFLNEVLEQTDQQYTAAMITYGKALRQRNALLELTQETGRRDEDRFAYWDSILISNGQLITRKREALINAINAYEKELFPFTLSYDKSEMSKERLLQYKDAEVGAGMTLVGPQRDDIIIRSKHPRSNEYEDVKYFCSRGQQRLVTLELKKSQISYLQKQLETQPVLVLDDIFSELDSKHIDLILSMIHEYQAIITTTHKEFIKTPIDKAMAVIELKDSI